MFKVYLSKSNNSTKSTIDKTRLLLDSIEGVKVVEYLGGTYSSKPLTESDFIVMVLPKNYAYGSLDSKVVGRGQYLQIKEFTETHPLRNILCVHERFSNYCYRIKEVNPMITVEESWNVYAEVILDNEEIILSEELSDIIEKNKKKTMKNSTTNSLKNRMLSQFMPVLADDLGISMDGNICIFKGEDAISINAQGELINYPKEMAMKCGLYLINKPLKDVNIGDIVKVNGSYGKVLGINLEKKDIRVLTYTGTKSTKVSAKDGLFNTNSVQVVLNVFGDSVQGMNPMMMMLLMDKEEGNNSFSSMLPFLMMSQQQNGQQNMFGSMNPMMLMMLMGKEDLDPMMLMMMGGFGNPMMQQQLPSTQQPNTQNK